MGSAGMVLIMTGHERETVWGTGAGALVNVVMNALLIPKWGIIGAAIANAMSNTIWSSMLMWLALHKIGVLVFPLTFNKRR
jgi:O-antigen/teichoic acid export membrane protein